MLPKSVKGFTLIEVVTALFVFLVLMIAVSGIFVSTLNSYKEARAVQRDTENAQYAVNIMLKELRTSSIASHTVASVRFYDYSQDICFSYRINASHLEMDNVAPASPSALTTAQKIAFCQAASLTSYEAVTTGTVTGSFTVIPSTDTPVSVGKVTVSLQIAEGTKHTTHLQTSASLRDYGYTGL